MDWIMKLRKPILLSVVGLLLLLSACHQNGGSPKAAATTLSIENTTSHVRAASKPSEASESVTTSTSTTAQTQTATASSKIATKSTTASRATRVEMTSSQITQTTVRTTQSYPKTMTPEIQKNKERIEQSLGTSVGSGERTAKILYTRGIKEIKEISVETKPYPLLFAPPQEMIYHFVHIVDEEGQSYSLELTEQGYLTFLCRGERIDGEHLYTWMPGVDDKMY